MSGVGGFRICRDKNCKNTVEFYELRMADNRQHVATLEAAMRHTAEILELWSRTMTTSQPKRPDFDSLALSLRMCVLEAERIYPHKRKGE